MMKNPSLRWRITLVAAIFSAFLLIIAILTGLYYCGISSFRSRPFAFQSIIGNETQSAPHRKLLRHAAGVEPNRIWGDKCSKADIVINQGPTAPLPSGIPTYTVEIMNVCVTGCDIAGIHLSCGWFSSARLINPRIFKRLRYDDCLVNAGKPLANGRTLSFQYARKHFQLPALRLQSYLLIITQYSNIYNSTTNKTLTQQQHSYKSN